VKYSMCGNRQCNESTVLVRYIIRSPLQKIPLECNSTAYTSRCMRRAVNSLLYLSLATLSRNSLLQLSCVDLSQHRTAKESCKRDLRENVTKESSCSALLQYRAIARELYTRFQVGVLQKRFQLSFNTENL